MPFNSTPLRALQDQIEAAHLVCVKVEKAEAEEGKEEAEELAGHLTQSENKKMTQIDSLKALLRRHGAPQHEIDEALRG